MKSITTKNNIFDLDLYIEEYISRYREIRKKEKEELELRTQLSHTAKAILGYILSHPDTKRALFFEGSKIVFGSCPYVVRLFTSYLYAVL